MKVKATLIFFLSCLATNLALPASITDDVELVPPKNTNTNYEDQPVDTGFLGGWENPFANPLGGFFNSFEDMMTRMKQQIHDLLENFSPLSGRNSTDEFGIDGLNLGKGNTTSVTKVIDGHKVVINETEYKKEDDFGGTYFKVRVIDVKPSDDEMTTKKGVESYEPNNIVQDKESVENTIDAKIRKSNEVDYQTNFNSSPKKLKASVAV